MITVIRDSKAAPINRHSINRRHVLTAVATALAAPAQMTRAHSDDTVPSHGISNVVPFPPGGQADFAARPLADALRVNLGVLILV